MSLLELKKEQKEVKNSLQDSGSLLSNFDMFMGFICHRIPERTFIVHGHYFPVCSRCTGFYIGAFSYFIFVYFFYVNYTISLVILAVFMLIPSLLDGFTQLFRFRESNNLLRLLTGLIGGVGLAILFKAIKLKIIMG